MITKFKTLFFVFFFIGQIANGQSTGLIDSWDFGAEQLNSEVYRNMLTVDSINAWYPGTVVVGSNGNILPNFTSGILSWTGGGNDRLRTTNTTITRFDENISSVTGFTGRVYVNSAAKITRFLSLNLDEDDEVTVFAKTDAGGIINFEYQANPVAQTDQVAVSTSLMELHFVAKQAGTYHIFDTQGKPSYYRIYRKDANYVNISGSVDISEAADIPNDYGIRFTNDAGKTWEAAVNSGTYSVDLPAGFTYHLSLTGANGYVINSATSVLLSDVPAILNVNILKVTLFTVSGSVTGLGPGISKLELIYTPDPAKAKFYIPKPEIDTASASYSVQLEPDCEYIISAKGVNDFYIADSSLTIGNADQTADISFLPRPLYGVTIVTSGLTAEQQAKLGLSFRMLYEDGYVYHFNSGDVINLRDGVYSIEADGLNDYPLELGLTSNLRVNGEAASKNLVFKQVKNWPFNDQVITNNTPSYLGLLFSGNIANEIAKGHLTAKAGATIQVPVNPGTKVRIAYYYSADFSIDGGAAITTSSGSTSTVEYADYIYPGTNAGFVTITIGSGTSTTYISNISSEDVVDYSAVIYVGADKTYKSLNAALDAISHMPRENNERVKVMIDPGNYEEMLVINVPDVSFVNAASKPSTELSNKGVDIDASAVRITSYYGHGYSYYSMGDNQKWDSEILRVNKENGYLSYENKGAGTTNGSFWNATVVVNADGFEAENIIFENSFNQYISKKESEDVVVMWEVGNKGLRPTETGSVLVQNKSFVERAAALAINNGVDKVVLKKCRVIGRQDSFFGGSGARVVVYKGAMMGGTDFLFGGMNVVFYKSDLVMNTSDESNDISYLTAAQQSSGRGFLMYECNIKSAVPGVENSSSRQSKPGYFGRPWLANTSEVVFYKTTIDTTNFPGSEGSSLILPLGWLNSLGGESALMYEYGTLEKSGVDNSAARAPWSTLLATPSLSDGTEISTFNFTKGNDDWDPIPALVAEDVTDAVPPAKKTSSVLINSWGSRIFVSNVKANTKVSIYNLTGSLVRSFETSSDTDFELNTGLWIVKVGSGEGYKTAKVFTP
ncbi:MAG: T9SS type A sorting domain-containing protein [Bacteroidales bacterium]|nr:T9SS type A sorting domain-containing protein [Bacteroidales bacterium]MCB9012817.1 T9SS type A sorting domain-containing protein [Bacteroidales bacterium]